MSYRCIILSDVQHLERTSLSSLRNLMLQMPNIDEEETRRLTYDDGNLNFNFTLDMVDEGRETLIYDSEIHDWRDEMDPLIHDQVNQVIASCGYSQDHISDLWDICFVIAEHLGWRVLDSSSGEYIEPY